ncbi:MAG: phosphate acyltransferase PlsX [Acidimicrobiia bacterium]
MLPVAVDAMGGDDAPEAVIAGVRMAIARGHEVLLVGRPDVLATASDIPGIAASEVIEMDDDAAQGVRRKKDSSLVRAAEAVRDGKASAMVSAGNTGATMASALLRMGRIKGVSRPAIATPIPTLGPTPTTLLDAGANAECQPEWLAQFAQMGSIYAQHRYGLAAPRVGLLSIGEESSKGTPMVKATHALLQHTPGINFVGNVEGRDVMTGSADVIVTDGFTGNVVLKTLEGGVGHVLDAIRAVFDSSAEYRAAADTLMPDLGPLLDVLTAEVVGGAMLLGVDGVCIISHGSSSPLAIANALDVARDMVEANLVEAIRLTIAGIEP